MKKTILIPITASIMCLGALALVPSKIVKVSAADAIINDGLYFLMSKDNSIGLQASTNTIASSTYAISDNDLSVPFTFTRLDENNHYSISCTINDVTTYFIPDGKNTEFSASSTKSAWLISKNADDTYSLQVIDGSETRYLYIDTVGSLKPLRGSLSSSSTDTFKFNLLSVQDSVDSLVTAIKNVDCSTKNPTNSDWEKIGTAYNAIPRPVLNYLDLENAEANKDAADTTLEWAMAKYDYVCGKYNQNKGFDDYLKRNPSYPTDGVNSFTTTKTESNNLTIIVTVMSLITIASVTSLLFFKRKRK